MVAGIWIEPTHSWIFNFSITKLYGVGGGGQKESNPFAIVRRNLQNSHNNKVVSQTLKKMIEVTFTFNTGRKSHNSVRHFRFCSVDHSVRLFISFLSLSFFFCLFCTSSLVHYYLHVLNLWHNGNVCCLVM